MNSREGISGRAYLYIHHCHHFCHCLQGAAYLALHTGQRCNCSTADLSVPPIVCIWWEKHAARSLQLSYYDGRIGRPFDTADGTVFVTRKSRFRKGSGTSVSRSAKRLMNSILAFTFPAVVSNVSEYVKPVA